MSSTVARSVRRTGPGLPSVAGVGWRERHGGGDERAAIAARARELLDAAGTRPSPGVVPSGAERGGGPTPVPFPPSHLLAAPEASGPAGSGSDESGLVASGSDGSAPGGDPTPRRGGWVPTTSALLAAGLPREATRPAGHDLAVDAGLRPFGSGPPGWSEHADAAPRPGWRDRVRWDPGRRGLVAVAAVVVVVGSVAGGAVLRTGSSQAVTVAAASEAAPADASAAPVTGASSPPVSPAPSAASSPSGQVTVDVAGLVVRPGVYTLPAGSRVEDALAAAGGPQPGADLAGLNRARVLVDGEQLAVGVAGAPAVPPATGGATTGNATGPAGLVDLNTAGIEQLDTLPGVGPVLAQAIVTWRTDHGRFGSVDDLQQVTGIGPSRFADLRALVTV